MSQTPYSFFEISVFSCAGCWSTPLFTHSPPVCEQLSSRGSGSFAAAFLSFFNSNFTFQLQFTFNIILYSFQMHSIVVRQSYTLQSGPPDISYSSGTVHSYYNIITVLTISCAALHIPVTIL